MEQLRLEVGLEVAAAEPPFQLSAEEWDQLVTLIAQAIIAMHRAEGGDSHDASS